MAKRPAKSAKADDEPRKFPPGTPEWKRRKCGLCGAEPGDNCFNLAAATGGALGGRPGKDGAMVKVKTLAPRQNDPHQPRTRA